MHNHHHEVLHVDVERAKGWTWQEVVERWHCLYQGKALSQRYLKGDALDESELRRVKEFAELWRERLMSISWFMRALNEPVARNANQEDECTGAFQKPGPTRRAGDIPKQLARFQGAEVMRKKLQPIPFSLKDYVELVEWTGRSIHPSKRGYISNELPPILKRIKISPEEWTDLAMNFEKHFTHWIGGREKLAQLCESRDIRHVHGSQHCRQVFSS